MLERKGSGRKEKKRRDGVGVGGGGVRADRDGIKRMRKTRGSRGRGVVGKGSGRKEG